MKLPNPTPTPSPRRMSLLAKVILWTVLSFGLGALAGWIGTFFDAPFYFGFFFGWVLVGLTGMFVVAVHVADQMERTHQMRREELERRL